MSNLKIGWSKRSISIDGPVTLCGQMHMRVSEAIADPLYVTVLCIDGGEGQDAAFLCSFDLESLRNGAVNEIRQAVKALRPEIPVDAIITGVTHTHTGLNLMETESHSPDGKPVIHGDECRAHVVKMATEAVVEAWDTRSEGGIAYGYGYAVVGHSRRVVYFDDTSLRSAANPVSPNGHGIMYGNTNDEQFSHYEAGSDHFLNTLFTFNKENKLTGMVINVPCPSQICEMWTVQSADYWCDVRKAVAEEYGDDVFVLPQCAPAGDLSPRILHYKQAQARRMALKYGLPYDPKEGHAYNKIIAERYDIAQRILEGVRDVYSWASKDIQTDIPVRHKMEVLQLPRRKITEEEKQWCEDNIVRMEAEMEEKRKGTPEEVSFAVSFQTSIINRNKRAVKRWENRETDPTLGAECHVVRLGDMAFATNQFELYMDFMHRIQARSPFIQTFVTQLTGEGATYVATERGVENKGYSASIFCNLVGHEGGQVMVEGILRMLNEVND